MKYFTLISIISMAISTLRDLFHITEEDAISKLQDFNIVPSSKLETNTCLSLIKLRKLSKTSSFLKMRGMLVKGQITGLQYCSFI